MSISEKDRGQLLRMAGNIACGLVTNCNIYDTGHVSKLSAQLALETMQAPDESSALLDAISTGEVIRATPEQREESRLHNLRLSDPMNPSLRKSPAESEVRP